MARKNGHEKEKAQQLESERREKTVQDELNQKIESLTADARSQQNVEASELAKKKAVVDYQVQSQINQVKSTYMPTLN